MIHTLLIAIFAVVFCCILMDEDMIFGFWSRWIDKLPNKVSFPLGGCAYCFGGQIALWYYPVFMDYNAVMHVFFVSTTIFFIHLTLYLYERTNG